MKRSICLTILFFSFFFIFFSLPKESFASSLSISPPTGNYSVGSTFDISILLNTKGKSVNAMKAVLSFPPEKLQVVSPSTGQSIIGVWTTAPKFNNIDGTITLEGGIPGGINVEGGILTKITFRVKSTGDAVIKFLDQSKVFLNDGLATDDLSQTLNAEYNLNLPPPQGPIVISDSHPDQSVWYSNKVASLRFVTTYPVEGYSYVLSNDPSTIPDNISEGTKPSVVYNNLGDGVNYFHIRALRSGVWGGVTHFAIKVDTTPPALFPVDILPSDHTSSSKPVIQFDTTDASSGLDHYELKLVPLSTPPSGPNDTGTFFIEADSPFVNSPLAIGTYNVIIRAYDKAGNYQEVTKHFAIVTPWLQIIGEKGLQIKNLVLLSWFWVWFIGILLLLIFGLVSYKAWKWHGKIHVIHKEKKLPADIANELSELQKYRAKYGKVAAVFLAMITLYSFFHFTSVSAETIELAPPLITTISNNISNKEIFYVGGKTAAPNETVILYSEDLATGETFSESIESDSQGDWFYRHNTFLSPGDYLLWVQGKIGDQFSPPSAQEKMTVKQTAIVFGSNRLSYEAIYLAAVIVLLLGIISLASFIAYHYYHGRRKYKKFQHDVSEAEESIKRGFAVLQRDIEAELAVIRKGNLSGDLSIEERHKETELLNDLNSVQKRIGDEIWQIKKESW